MKLRDHNMGFIGAGTVATVLAKALHEAGFSVAAVTSRSPESTDRLSRALHGAATRCPSAQAVADACDLVFLTTPDDPIANVARAVSWRSGQVVVHCSGAITVKALEPAATAGAVVGGFHPLQTFAGAEASSLGGATIALEGDGAALTTLQGLAEALDCPWVTVRGEDKALYHISGVLASNYVVTLLRHAVGLWEEIGLSEEQASRALLSLLKGTVQNMETLGVNASLTGPVARGDAGTIETHLEELARKAPALLSAYRELGWLTIPVAESHGTLDAEDAQRLRRLLGGVTSDKHRQKARESA